jgi:ankyrin repeat protein
MPLVLRCPQDVAMAIFLFAPHAVVDVKEKILQNCCGNFDPMWRLPPLDSIDPGDIITTHLQQALLHYEVDIVVILLKSIRCGPWRRLGLDLNKVNRGRETAVYIAAYVGHVRCLRTLSEMGADVNATNYFGMTPLYRAAFGGHESCIRALHRLGADVHQVDRTCSTAVHLAASNGHIKCILALHELGADIHKRNHMAAEGRIICQQKAGSPFTKRLARVMVQLSGPFMG